MPTRLEIIQRAQARIGDEPIVSETAPGAPTLVAIYDDVRDDLLSRYPWKFARVIRRLTRLSAVPEAHWSYYYQLPSDMLGAPRAVYDSASEATPCTRFEITENRLATDAAEIWLEFGKRPEIVLWPGYFLSIVTKGTMREFALTIREDSGLWRALGEELYGSAAMMGEGGLFGQAKNLDAQSGPSPVIAEGASPLTDVRR